MNDIFSKFPFVVVHTDDITTLSDNAEQHKQHLNAVFDKLMKNHIKNTYR